MFLQPDIWLTSKEIARRLGRSRSWLNQKRREHKLEFQMGYRMGVLGISESALNEYIRKGAKQS